MIELPKWRSFSASMAAAARPPACLATRIVFLEPDRQAAATSFASEKMPLAELYRQRFGRHA
jgi:hypothetical protein